MDNDFLNDMQMQETQRMQEEFIRQEWQRQNDPVQRGDWDKKKNKKQDSKKAIIVLLAFIVFASLFIFAMVAKGQNAKSVPVQEEQSVISMYEGIMTDESKEQYQKMEQQMQEIKEKEEKNERNWTLICTICAVCAMIPTFIVLGSFISSGKPVPPFKEAAKAIAICLGGAVALFAVNFGCIYVLSEGNTMGQELMVLLLAIILIIAVWIYTKGLSNKD